MRAASRIRALARTLVHGRRLERDLDDELAAYLAHRIREREAEGLSLGEARRQVLAEEGGLEAVKEHTRDARAGWLLTTIAQDLAYGWRTMRRTPGYSVVAVLTLALGIGASVTMFTVVHSILWRPLPYADSDRLVELDAAVRDAVRSGLSAHEAHAMLANTRIFSDVALVNGVDAHVEIDGEIERVAAASVTESFLRTLGVGPALGRGFDERDRALSDEGQVRTVVISDALWRRRLAADPAAIGRWILVNNSRRQVIGVLPPTARMFLPPSTGVQEDTDVWFPTQMEADDHYRGNGAIARLADGIELQSARRELDALAERLSAEQPTRYAHGLRFHVEDLRAAVTTGVERGLHVLGLAVAFVLLLACVNVANLTLARAMGRGREIAVRRALGAGRARLIRQLLTESVLLSAIAGAIGLSIAQYGIDLLEWLRPTHLPRQAGVGMDTTVVLFAVGLSILTGALAGIVPAIRSAGADVTALRAGRADSPSRGARRWQRALVIAEITLSIVPLVAAGLMLRSFVNLQHAPLGFSPHGIVTAWMPVSFRKFSDADARWRVHQDVFDRLRAIPGIEAVSAGSLPPFHPDQFTRLIGRDNEDPATRVTMQSVLPGYLPIVGTRMLIGRDFTDEDIRNKRPVVIVDSRIARMLGPGEAIGRHVVMSGRPNIRLEVIGVTEPVRVADVRSDGLPHLFLPYHQFPPEMALVVKTSIPPAALEPMIRRAAAEAGTGRAVFNVWPLQTYVDRAMAGTRFVMLVLAGFALAALALAGIGLYGTLSYLSSQRQREFGLRLVLGASRRGILGHVAREGLLLAAAGVVLGLGAAAAAGRMLRTLLYGVEPIDQGTLITVGSLVVAIALVACIRPAWAAARVDPAAALRAD